MTLLQESRKCNISLAVIFLSAQSFGHACSFLPPLVFAFFVRKYFSLFKFTLHLLISHPHY